MKRSKWWNHKITNIDVNEPKNTRWFNSQYKHDLSVNSDGFDQRKRRVSSFDHGKLKGYTKFRVHRRLFQHLFHQWKLLLIESQNTCSTIPTPTPYRAKSIGIIINKNKKYYQNMNLVNQHAMTQTKWTRDKLQY